MSAHRHNADAYKSLTTGWVTITDPGNGNTIPSVDLKAIAICELTSAAAETRLLPNPGGISVGSKLILVAVSPVGIITIQGAAEGSFVLTDGGDFALLIVSNDEGTHVWKIIHIGNNNSLPISGFLGNEDNAIVRVFGASGTLIDSAPSTFVTDNGFINQDNIEDQGLTFSIFNGTELNNSDSDEPVLSIKNTDGSDAGFHFNANGSSNGIFIGTSAGLGTTTGDTNIGIGSFALFDAPDASSSVGIGSNSLELSENSNVNFMLGNESGRLSVDCSSNTGLGFRVMSQASTCSGNIIVGNEAMYQATGCEGNSVFGNTSMRSSDTCNANLAVGDGALDSAIQCENNVALNDSLDSAMYCSGNIALSSISGASNSSDNIAVGDESLNGSSYCNDNLALGTESLSGAVQSDRNISVGKSSMSGSSTYSYDNIAIGQSSLYGTNNSQYNIALGKNTLPSNYGVNNIAIGYGMDVPSPGGSDQLNIQDRIVIDSNGVVLDTPTPSYKPSYDVESYAAGTAYTVTDTPSAVDFGTTDPVVVLAQPGVYKVSGWAVVENINATFAANETLTLALHEDNNVNADLDDGLSVYTFPIIAVGITETAAIIYWEASEYTTANTDDTITIYASLSTAPGAGSVEISQAFVKAMRIR